MPAIDRAAIESFYDRFSDRRMSRYRSAGNARLDAAIAFIAQNIHNGQVILDIGCGVGIATEALAEQAPATRFVGIDISGANIRNARDMVRLSNVEFIQASVPEQVDEVASRLGGPADAIYMVDVVEHLPEEGRRELLAQLAGLASQDCTLLMTYPSPEFQRHLAANNPSELQIIDNVIEIDVLAAEALAAGWKLHSFRYVNVWSTNQYIHVAFVRRLPLDAVPFARPPLLRRAVAHIRRKFARRAAA